MDAHLARVREAVARFASMIELSGEFSEDLAREYNRMKRVLAVNFQEMSLAALPLATYRLADVKSAVVTEMNHLFAGRVDSRLFRIGGYMSPHPQIYSLLASRVGERVPGWRLRLLSGDKIHTERRTRELRDLGLEIDVVEENQDSLYELKSLEPDLTYGAAFQLRENVMKSRALDSSDRRYIRNLAENAAQLPPRKGPTE